MPFKLRWASDIICTGSSSAELGDKNILVRICVSKNRADQEQEGMAFERVLFYLLVVLNADFVGDAGMTETEGFAFSATNDLPLY